MSTAGYSLFKLGYQISPVILTNGIASAIPGGMLPIIAITEAANFTLGLLEGTVDIDLDSYFAQFKPLPGATLVNNQIGQYPFANQQTAANAIIAQPLNISMLMICPAQTNAGYTKKLITLSALKKALDQHNLSGGTYTIATPSYIYTNCVMTGFKDVSSSDDQQMQNTWQLDFLQPLISLADAQTAYNSLMSVLANGLPVSGQPTWSGIANTIGSSVSGASNTLVTGAQNLLGTAVSNIVSTNSSTTNQAGLGG